MIEPHPFLKMYVDRMARPEIERHAALHGMTPEELSGTVRESLKDVLSDAHLWLYINTDRLKATLETGVIPNRLQSVNPESDKAFTKDWGIRGAIVEILLNQRRDVLYHGQLSTRINTKVLKGGVVLKLDPSLKEISTFTEGGTSTNLSYHTLFPHVNQLDVCAKKYEIYSFLDRMTDPGADVETLFDDLLRHISTDTFVPPVHYFDSPPVLNSPISDPSELSWSWGTRPGYRQGCPICQSLRPGLLSVWAARHDTPQSLGDYHRFVPQIPGLIPLHNVSEVIFLEAVKNRFEVLALELGQSRIRG